MARFTIRATQDENVFCQSFKAVDPARAEIEGRLILADAWDIEIEDDDPDALAVERQCDTFVVDPSPEIDAFLALIDAAKALMEGASDDPFEELRAAIDEAEKHRSTYS